METLTEAIEIPAPFEKLCITGTQTGKRRRGLGIYEEILPSDQIYSSSQA